jgi:hypothetical protein
MKGNRLAGILIFALMMVTVAAAMLVPDSALAWPAEGHHRGTHMGLNMFSFGDISQQIENWDLMEISRDRQTPLYPELKQLRVWYNLDECDDEIDDDCDGDYKWTQENWSWVKAGSWKLDNFATCNHFWNAHDGLDDETLVGCDNAVQTIMPIWVQALDSWWNGNLGRAYAKLGYALHLIEDMGQPAHANDDMHADDSLEDWMHPQGSDYNYEAHFQWSQDMSQPICYGCPESWDRTILYVPTNNASILNDMFNANPNWEVIEDQELYEAEWDILRDPNSIINQQQLFYILYYVNQTANYFASDNGDGNSDDPIGWLNGYPGFPGNELHYDCDLSLETSVHDQWGLADNDVDDSDCDGDLSLIAKWTYGTVYRAIPAVINLFRRTLDNAPPDTTVEMSRLDGKPIIEWNNSSVTVQLTDAIDSGNYGRRASGKWRVWGLHYGPPHENIGMPPDDYNGTLPEENYIPSWVISEDGIHTIECLSTDLMGNVDTKDITVKFDGTPPEITFPDLKPLYLTSEEFIATWHAYDATSGIKPGSEEAYLDGNWVLKNQVIDLALMAGMHRLEVSAEDNATNKGYAFYDFEVLIDADGWAKPINIANNPHGKAMFVTVEFPAPYDVGLIDYTTCTLIVNGVQLPAEMITGVGDNDGDHIRDRMLRFDKEQFIKALGGQVGDIQAAVWGGLLPDGMPRFVADVTVPVFNSPPK